MGQKNQPMSLPADTWLVHNILYSLALLLKIAFLKVETLDTSVSKTYLLGFMCCVMLKVW
jgi:hypothetical protein